MLYLPIFIPKISNQNHICSEQPLSCPPSPAQAEPGGAAWAGLVLVPPALCPVRRMGWDMVGWGGSTLSLSSFEQKFLKRVKLKLAHSHKKLWFDTSAFFWRKKSQHTTKPAPSSPPGCRLVLEGVLIISPFIPCWDRSSHPSSSLFFLSCFLPCSDCIPGARDLFPYLSALFTYTYLFTQEY